MSFKVIEEKNMEDIQSKGILYEHIETGAKVLYIQNEDVNRAFTIGFKTPPYSDNGITHIIEHSVLNGSQKFPTKEPFVDLLKGSLYTFVNASTYSDKTIFPIASTNQKDYLNLMEVYLDAVFHPLMLQNPQILAQEGWHYHLEKPEDNLTYKGVVYNEMKGAIASPESKIYDLTTRNLFKGTHYQWMSGGEPGSIPNLTQEEFVKFHSKYYHPSNSLTVVYGKIDFDATFDLLAEYFDQYTKQATSVNLSINTPEISQEVIEDSYSLTEGDSSEGKDFMAIAWDVARPEEVLDGFGLSVLSEILFGTPQSPLRKALLDADIAGDVEGGFEEVGYPRIFEIMLKYSSADKMDQFREIVQTTLESLVQNGINPDIVQAAMNKITFRLKELVISESSPRGVIYAAEIYNTWLYGGNPVSPLEFSKYLGKLEKLAKQGYFETLIQEKLLNNKQKVEIILKGEAGKNDRLEAEKIAKLQEYKNSLSEEEINHLIQKTQALIERQENPDSPEDLAKIPVLKKSDLKVETEDIPLLVESIGTDRYFYHAPQFTSGIDYVRLYLNINDFTPEEFSWLKLFSKLLTKLDTKDYSASELQTQIDLLTGGIGGSVVFHVDRHQKIKPFFVFTGRALEASTSSMLALMKHILTTTQLDNETGVLQVVQKGIASFDQEVNYNAHSVAANRALSHLLAGANMAEKVSGIDYYNFLKEIRTQIQDGQFTTVLQKLTAIQEKVINLNRLSLFYIGDTDRGAEINLEVAEVFNSLPQNPLGKPVEYQPGQKQNEAFVTAQDVNYVAQASFNPEKLAYTGEDEVLSNLLRYDYLWNNIRVMGGAYGATYTYKIDNSVVFASYRDPNIKETLNTYQGVPDFIKSLDLSQESFDKSIIGTMNRFDRPLSAFDKGMKAFMKYMSGYTLEEETKVKQEILEADLASIKAKAQNYEDAFAEHSVVVIGNKAQIDQNKECFDVIKELY